MKLWPGIFQVTNCIVNGGNGGFLVAYRITVHRTAKLDGGGISKEYFFPFYL